MGLMLLEKTTQLSFPRFLIFLGDASYSVYLIHYTALSVAAKIFYRLWLRYPVPMAVPFAAMTFLALGFGIAVHLLIEQPLLRLIPRSLKKRAKSSSFDAP
jgi:peptidoglycan/LPS O-acetylase OafA/YrhL